jgi:hypothetical protein
MASTSTLPRAAHPSTSVPIGRRAFGVLRIAASALLVAALFTQIYFLVINDALIPNQYFAFFTIQSSFFNVVVLATGGMFALRRVVDPQSFTMIRIATLTYAIVTGAVYNVLLRGAPGAEYIGPQWPNEVLHVWIPLYILLDFLLAPGRPAVRWSTLWLVVSYPIVWAVATLIRGAITGWYPYPFLDPTGPTGYGSVVAYVGGLSAFIVALGCAAVGLSKWRARA